MDQVAQPEIPKDGRPLLSNRVIANVNGIPIAVSEVDNDLSTKWLSEVRAEGGQRADPNYWAEEGDLLGVELLLAYDTTMSGKEKAAILGKAFNSLGTKSAIYLGTTPAANLAEQNKIAAENKGYLDRSQYYIQLAKIMK